MTIFELSWWAATLAPLIPILAAIARDKSQRWLVAMGASVALTAAEALMAIGATWSSAIECFVRIMLVQGATYLLVWKNTAAPDRVQAVRDRMTDAINTAVYKDV